MDMISSLFQVDEFNRISLFGFSFYVDDLLIMLLLAFFYFEKVEDSILYVALLLILFM